MPLQSNYDASRKAQLSGTWSQILHQLKATSSMLAYTTHLVITTDMNEINSLYSYLATNSPRIVLPACVSFHLTTNHPSDLAHFQLPNEIQYLGFSIHPAALQYPHLGPEMDVLLQPGLLPSSIQQLNLALPLCDVRWIMLLKVIGRHAALVRISFGPQSEMARGLVAGLREGGTYSAGLLLPSLRQLQVDVRFSRAGNVDELEEALVCAAETRKARTGSGIKVQIM